MEVLVWVAVLVAAAGLAYWKIPAFKAFVDKWRKPAPPAA